MDVCAGSNGTGAHLDVTVRGIIVIAGDIVVEKRMSGSFLLYLALLPSACSYLGGERRGGKERYPRNEEIGT